MGADFYRLSPAARRVYERASELLGRDVAALCFRATPDVLRDTRNAQIAVVVTNLAAYELLRESGFCPGIVAGHSVGELSALFAAGCLDLDDVIRAVKHRADLMGNLDRGGSMAAVIGLPAEHTEALCAEVHGESVVPAVYNSDSNTVVSGSTRGVAIVSERARGAGGRITELQVSHAFHSPLMATVTDAWSAFVRTLHLRDPTTPLVLNVTGCVAAVAAEVREAVIAQVTHPVRWRGTMATLRATGAELAVETGSSRVLTGFARNTSDGVRMVSLGVQRTLAEFLRPGGSR